MSFYHYGIEDPMMLHVIQLASLGHCNAQAVVTDRQDWHPEVEASFKYLVSQELERRSFRCDESVVTKQSLAKVIFDVEADDWA